MARNSRQDAPFWVTMRKHEKDLILWYLKQANHHIQRAAEMAGVDSSFFYKKIKEFKIELPEKPPPKRPRRKKKGSDDTSIGSLAD